MKREDGISLIAKIIVVIVVIFLGAISINTVYKSGIINYSVNGTTNNIEE